ncbi:MAG: exodeoxyribonuclease VII small subunit [Planctomycetota bacterium]|jgi:exodeoxyribonuclease VII small subunit
MAVIMAKKTTKNEFEDVPFETAIGDLTAIVEKIENGQVSLAESLGQYEKGMALIKHCRGILLDAEKRIEEIAADEPEDDDLDDDGLDEDLEDDEDDDSLF